MKCWTVVLVLLVLAWPRLAPVGATSPSTDSASSAAATAASAASSSPTEAWARTVAALAETLASGADTGALAAVLTEGARVRDFDGPDDVSLTILADVAREARLVGHHAYTGAPRTLASDLAEDFRLVEEIPADQKNRMIPATAAAAEKADAVGREWITAVLGVADRDPVGVLVLWHPTIHEDKPGSVFVLVRGTTDGSGIAEVVFGHPLPQ